MSFLAHWTQTPVAHALGWTLFHFLWEGVAVAAALAIALLFVRPARLRYAAACVALITMLAACGATFARVYPRQAAPAPIAAGLRASALPSGELPAAEPKPFRAEDLLPWAAPVWLAGVLLLHARMAAAWMGIRRLRRSAAPAAQPWRDGLAALAGRLGVARAVELLETCAVDVPVVVGHLRPAILLPLGLLAGMPAGHLEAILLHELAHIRRRDYVVNLLQTVAENLLFYHPAIWWVSGVIRAERENCCDDLAVAVRGNAHEYAVALTALESRRITGEPALAANGGDLMKRIHRLLDRPAPAHAALTPVFSAVLVLLTAAVALTAWQAAPQEQPQPAAPQPRPAIQRREQERRERLRATVAAPYEKWLRDDVAYIIDDRERTAFQALTTDAERERFIEQFWTRRDPTPGTVENEFKEEHYRRIAYANEKFADAGLPGWKTDRGRVYITYGPPDELEKHPAEARELWRYRHLQGIGDDVIVEFADRDGSGRLRMTNDPHAPPPANEAAVARQDIWMDTVQRGDMPVRVLASFRVEQDGQLALVSAGAFQPGQRATVTIGGKHAGGSVVRGADERFYLRLDSPAEVEGSTLTGLVELEPLHNVLHVARPVGAQPNSVGVVYRLAPDGRSATQVGVLYGQASVNRIQIKSGIEPGERIIVSDMSAYSRFLRVEVR